MEIVDNIFNSLVTNKNGFKLLDGHVFYQYTKYIISKRIEEIIWCHKPFDDKIFHQLYIKGFSEGIVIKFE